jgi:hypothetical protein
MHCFLDVLLQKEIQMHQKIYVFFICLSVFIFSLVISQVVRAEEAPPPASAAPPAQITHGGAAGDTGTIVMDPKARAVLPTDSFDFGSVYEGNDVFHDFIIKNEGTADLKIINVKSG